MASRSLGSVGAETATTAGDPVSGTVTFVWMKWRSIFVKDSPEYGVLVTCTRGVPSVWNSSSHALETPLPRKSIGFASPAMTWPKGSKASCVSISILIVFTSAMGLLLGARSYSEATQQRAEHLESGRDATSFAETVCRAADYKSWLRSESSRSVAPWPDCRLTACHFDC